MVFFCLQAEDGIRYLVRSRGLGDVYKRQADNGAMVSWWPDGGTTPFRGEKATTWEGGVRVPMLLRWPAKVTKGKVCLLYTSDAADERSSVDLGGRRSIKKKKKRLRTSQRISTTP